MHDSLFTFVQRQNSVGGRYWNLNLQSLLTHGTVEFRLFNSTVNTEALRLMVELSSRLVRAVRTKDPALLEYMRGKTDAQVRLDGMDKALGVDLGRHASTRRN